MRSQRRGRSTTIAGHGPGSRDVLTSLWMDSEVDNNAENNSGTSSDMPRLETPTPIKKRWRDKYDRLPSVWAWTRQVSAGSKIPLLFTPEKNCGVCGLDKEISEEGGRAYPGAGPTCNPAICAAFDGACDLLLCSEGDLLTEKQSLDLTTSGNANYGNYCNWLCA